MTKNYYSVGFDNGFTVGMTAGLLLGSAGVGLVWLILSLL